MRVFDGLLETLGILERGSTFGVRLSSLLSTRRTIRIELLAGEGINDRYRANLHRYVEDKTGVISSRQRGK